VPVPLSADTATSPQVLCGDCARRLPELAAGDVDLVYLDPPFFTQKSHALRTRDRQTQFSFDDLWSSHEEYCRFLDERLVELERVMAPHGALFFHCDRRASHLVRLLLDRRFGTSSFRSEIIWTYRRWSNSARQLQPAHQTIYYYTRSNDYTFHLLRDEYSPSTNVDQILQRRVGSGQVRSAGSISSTPQSEAARLKPTDDSICEPHAHVSRSCRSAHLNRDYCPGLGR